MPGSSEGDRDRPQRAISGSERVAGGHGDGPSEGSREHDMAGLEMLSLRRELIGKPSDTHCGMPHDRRGNARLLDDAVLRQGRTDPTNIDIERPDHPSPGDECARCRVVGYRVADRSRPFGPIVDDL